MKKIARFTCIALLVFAFTLLSTLAEDKKNVNPGTEIYLPLKHSPQAGFSISNPPTGNQGVPDIKNTMESAPDRILVKYKQRENKNLSKAAEESIRTKHNLDKLKEISLTNLTVYKLKEPKNKNKILDELKKDPDVEYAEPDYLLKLNVVPDDPSFQGLWGLNNTGQTSGTANCDIDAPEAWAYTTGNEDVIVGVIDTGVDYTHPDLNANMWRNPGEIPGDNIDNDNNGYIDDVYGINSITDSGNPMDDHGHGTHCSGTIGAAGNNSIGVTGVCWRVKIMALKFLAVDGSGYTSDAIECVSYAIAKGAHILSNSWGGTMYSQALFDALSLSKDAGQLVVAAAGNWAMNNDGFPFYPANYDLNNIISVAATDHNDTLASFSNYGQNSVDVAAPGAKILSTLPNNTYGIYSGTSMAAPHVSGLAALIKAAAPSFTYSQLKNQIVSTVDLIPSLSDKLIYGGRINAYNALSTLNPPPAIALTTPQENAFVSGQTDIELNVTDSDGVSNVQLFVNSILKNTFTSAPYRYSLDTTTLPSGLTELKAIALDSGNRKSEKKFYIYVNNSGLPVVNILSPVTDSTITGKIKIKAIAGYSGGIEKVEFLLGEALLSESSVSPFEFTWDSYNTPNGSYVIKAKAYTSDEQVVEAQVNITVKNVHLPQSERDALIAFYNSTSGSNWFKENNWKKMDGTFNDRGTEDTWFGLTISNDHVIKIEMIGNSLGGILPPEISGFSQLQVLDIMRNSISGPIPATMGSLSLLQYLDISYNNLTGTLPPELGNLSNLVKLYLEYNSITGSIPPEYGNLTSIQHFYIINNLLSGSIPSQLGNLNNVTLLALQNNQLTGSIPPELGNCSKLQHLLLDNNLLSGSIPAQLGNLSSLVSLWLNNNRLTGIIPPGIGNLTKMQIFLLNDNQLSGSIPVECGNMASLLWISLANNQLTGSIPSEFQYCSFLDVFILSNNQLSGSIPEELGNMKNCRTLNLSQNQLTGSIPDELYNLTRLNTLKLSNNKLSGTISPLIGQLIYLNECYLDNNQLSGSIPPEIGNLTYVTTIKLNSNRLSGEIPVSMTNYKQVSWVLVGYNSLYTSDTVLRSFLGRYGTGWESTQTLAPQNTSAVVQSSSSILLSWTPIAYTGDEGGYNIYMSGNPGGPYSFYNSKANKAASSMLITGLSAGYNYYFVIKSFTKPHANNQNTVISDYSREASASISTTKSLRLTAPIGGETLKMGSTYTIKWNYNEINEIKLELLKNGKSYMSIISAMSASKKAYTWTIPTRIPAGNDFSIKISSLDAGVNIRDNGNTFSIISDPVLSLHAPNSFETWQAGRSYDITWGSNGISNIKIELYKNNLLDSVICNSTPAVSGKYSWNIPAGQSPASNYKIKISALDQGITLSDMSVNPFTIISYKKTSADFNSDGKSDILWRYYSDGGYNCIWPMPVSTSPESLSDPTGHPDAISLLAESNIDSIIVGFGDFNLDGYEDIVWRNTVNGADTVWYMNGTTYSSTALLLQESDPTFEIAGVSDFNRDGKPDILWRNQINGTNSIRLMDGILPVSSVSLPVLTDRSWKVGGTGDFDLDKNPDIVWWNKVTGQLMVWFMNGTTYVRSEVFPGYTNGNWEIAGIGDYDGDTTADILWRNISSGKNTIWYMDGLSRASIQNLTTVTNLSWKSK